MSNHPSEQPQIIVHGNYIAEQNIQTQNNFFGKENHLSNDHSTANTQVNTLATEGHKSVADELMPFFFMNRDKVEEFLALAQNSDSKKITKMVNHYVAANEINRTMHKGDLFEILKRGNIYKAGRSTWYDQVDF